MDGWHARVNGPARKPGRAKTRHGEATPCRGGIQVRLNDGTFLVVWFDTEEDARQFAASMEKLNQGEER
jgi:hypothetical protein